MGVQITLQEEDVGWEILQLSWKMQRSHRTYINWSKVAVRMNAWYNLINVSYYYYFCKSIA
jgi:hypothetical protein